MNTNIKALFETYSRSVFKKDLDLFLSIFDENIQAFDMWQKWSHRGLGEWRQTTQEWFASLESEQVVVEFSEIKEATSGDLGYATAFVKFQAQTLSGQNIRCLENRLTWVLSLKSGHWKIIHQHTSSPLDDSTQAILKREQP